MPKMCCKVSIVEAAAGSDQKPCAELIVEESVISDIRQKLASEKHPEQAPTIAYKYTGDHICMVSVIHKIKSTQVAGKLPELIFLVEPLQTTMWDLTENNIRDKKESEVCNSLGVIEEARYLIQRLSALEDLGPETGERLVDLRSEVLDFLDRTK